MLDYKTLEGFLCQALYRSNFLPASSGSGVLAVHTYQYVEEKSW